MNCQTDHGAKLYTRIRCKTRRRALAALLGAVISTATGCADGPSTPATGAADQGKMVQIALELDELSEAERPVAMRAYRDGVAAADRRSPARLSHTERIDAARPFITVSFRKPENFQKTVEEMRQRAGFPMNKFIDAMTGTGCYSDIYAEDGATRFAWIAVNFAKPAETQRRCVAAAVDEALGRMR